MRPKRIKDPMLIKSMRGEPCIICGLQTGSPHHVKTVGSGGDDVEENLVSLCYKHHSEIHLFGRITFARRYKEFRDWCEKWERFDILDKIEDIN